MVPGIEPPEPSSNLLAWIAKKPPPVAAAAPAYKPTVDDKPSDRYTEAAFSKELDALRGVREGQRNAALNKSAFSLGQFVGAGTLSRTRVEAALLAAGTALGLPHIEAEKTIRSGIDAGMKQPRQAPAPRESRRTRPKADQIAPAPVYDLETGEVIDASEAASGQESLQSPTNLPIIKISGGALPAEVDAGEEALLISNCGLYRYGNWIARPVLSEVGVAGDTKIVTHRLSQVKVPHMMECFTRAAWWMKFDGRSKDWVPVDCPQKIAEVYLARDGEWRLPKLTGIITAPTLRPDGSILDKPGYDEKTGFLFEGNGQEFPPISNEPDQSDAAEALGVIKDLLKTFPFVSDIDRSCALSGVLTALVRRSLSAAPLHAFTAPTAGSGKSLLVDIISMIATGRPAGVIAQGKTEEEMENRLAATFLAGDLIVSIDNCELPLGGDLLCQALTQMTLKIRIMHTKSNAEVLTNAAIFATGNNLTIAGDLTRRAILCSLDPQCERPELREFDADPLKVAGADRGKYVAAGLTVLRAFHLAGQPEQAAPIGSFGTWSKWIRDALIWLGEPDPCASMENTRAGDPRRAAMIAVFEQWDTVIGNRRVPVKEVIEKAVEQADDYQGSSKFVHADFREALLTVAGDGGAINSRRLGRWLLRHQNQLVGTKRIIQDGSASGVAYWRLVNQPP